MITEHEGMKAADFVCTAEWCGKAGLTWSYTEWNPRHKRPMLVCPDWHLSPGSPRRAGPPPTPSS